MNWEFIKKTKTLQITSDFSHLLENFDENQRKADKHVQLFAPIH